MRVAFIDQIGDAAGGAQESLALLLANLPATIEPAVVLFADGAYAQRLRALGLDVTVFALSAAISEATRERPALVGGLAVPTAAARIATFLRRRRIELVHTNSVKAHVVGGVAAKFARLPGVAHLRDILEGRGRAIVRTVATICSRERIAIAGSVARSYALDRTTVIENPLDLARYATLPTRAAARTALGLPLDVPIAAVVGRINRWKGQDRFVRAAAAIAQTSNAHFAIVGQARFRDADFVPELHALVGSLGLQSRFSFLDWVEDPRDIYAAIDVHVNCSTREPFGRTVIEAAAARVPTVCFDDSGVAEFMKPDSGGRAVAAGDVSALARALGDFLSNAAARERAGREAGAWSSRFDAHRHAGRVADILLRAAS